MPGGNLLHTVLHIAFVRQRAGIVQAAQRTFSTQGPIIEEVDDHHHSAHLPPQRPIVEEPEDQEEEEEDEVVCQHAQPPAHPLHLLNHPFALQPLAPFFGSPAFTTFPAMTTSSSYSYSSYSSVSGGQVTYSKTTCTRIGPNGAAETTESVHDGRTGERRSRVARRLGDREHVVSTARDTRGMEERQEVLNNIRDDADRQRFEREWARAAPQSLLGTRERSLGRGFERSVQPRLEGWM